MSFKAGFWLALGLLLLAAALRLWALTSLPAGLNDEEITDIRITETARLGSIEVFYDLGDQGREGMYHTILAAVTGAVGNGQLGYHLFSAWVSLLTLALVYALGLRLYGPLAGVAAMALMAVNLTYLLAGREVSREILLPGLVAAAILLLARSLSVYRYTHLRLPLNTAFAALGLLLGLGFYVHPAHFMIVLFSILFIIYRLMSRQPLSQPTMGYLRFSLLVGLIVATPYLISSLRLPELSGITRIWGDYRITEVSPAQAYVDGLAGIFLLGDENPLHNLPGRPLIDLVSGLIVLVGFISAAREWRQPRYAVTLIAALSLSPIVFLDADSPDFWRYLALLPPLALFFGLGASTLYRSILSPSVRRLAWVGLVALLAFNLVWVRRDLYVNWPSQPEVAEAYHSRVGQIAHYLDRAAGRLPLLICDSQLGSAGRLTDTDLLLLTMNRKQIQPRFADCGTGMVFINGGEGQHIVFLGANALDNLHPYLRDWTAYGELMADPMLPPKSIVRLSVAQQLADTIGRFTTTSPAGYAPEAPGTSNLAAPPIRFGGNLTFLGYEPDAGQPYRPGSVYTSITYWRVDGRIPPDLRLFTHVLSDPSAVAAQNDSISIDARELQNRDVFMQITFIQLPFSIPDGMYSISIGAYQAETLARMGVLDNGQPRGTRLFLGQIRVTG